MEKHELGKVDFDIIGDAFKALLQSDPAIQSTRRRSSIYAISFETPSQAG
jgi:hypothetical protein